VVVLMFSDFSPWGWLPGSKNYKLQFTNYKQITNYNVRNYKQKTKGSHGLHQDSFKLQTMTALIKSFCGGGQGGQFFQKAPPLAAGGKGNENSARNY
jgi:hypothetical protein